MALCCEGPASRAFAGAGRHRVSNREWFIPSVSMVGDFGTKLHITYSYIRPTPSLFLLSSTPLSLAPPTARQRKIINEYYRYGGSSPSIAWRVPVLAQDFARHTAFAQHQHQCRSGQHVQLAGNCWSLPRHGQGIGCPEHSPQHSLVRYLWWLPSLQRSHYPCPSCLPAHHPC